MIDDDECLFAKVKDFRDDDSPVDATFLAKK